MINGQDLIESEKYTIIISRKANFMHFIFKPDIVFEAEDALRSKNEVTALRPGEKFFVLAEGVEFFTLTKEARELAATAGFSDNTIAIAFYTTNISLTLLMEVYNKINKPAVPTKVFSDKEQAMNWLVKEGLKMPESG